MTRTLPRVHRLNDRMPIIKKIESNPWENKVTFNPACVLVDNTDDLETIIPGLPFSDEIKKKLTLHPALCFLLYRAQGKKTAEYDYTRSSIGLAVLSAELQLLARHDCPVIRPEEEYDNLGVEDGRITKVGDRYVMVYCAYSSGQPGTKMRIALASTKDFVHWEKHGLLKGDFNTINNKNAMLFWDKLDDKYLMLHRPMEGSHAMSIHWAEADDVFGEWESRGLFMEPIDNPAFADTWIGGGAPPLRIDDKRHLIIYHIGNRKSDTTRVYELGIATAHLTQKDIIVKRDEPLIQPWTDYETIGDADLGVNNVVFICGAYFYNGDLYFPYAGADSVVLAGRIAKRDISAYLSE